MSALCHHDLVSHYYGLGRARPYYWLQFVLFRNDNPVQTFLRIYNILGAGMLRLNQMRLHHGGLNRRTDKVGLWRVCFNVTGRLYDLFRWWHEVNVTSDTRISRRSEFGIPSIISFNTILSCKNSGLPFVLVYSLRLPLIVNLNCKRLVMIILTNAWLHHIEQRHWRLLMDFSLLSRVSWRILRILLWWWIWLLYDSRQWPLLISDVVELLRLKNCAFRSRCTAPGIIPLLWINGCSQLYILASLVRLRSVSHDAPKVRRMGHIFVPIVVLIFYLHVEIQLLVQRGTHEARVRGPAWNLRSHPLVNRVAIIAVVIGASYLRVTYVSFHKLAQGGLMAH